MGGEEENEPLDAALSLPLPPGRLHHLTVFIRYGGSSAYLVQAGEFGV